MSKRSVSPSVVLTVIAMSILLAGCQGAGHESPSGDAETPAVLELGPEAQAILAKADLADGTEDHVVAKCPACQLAMEGSPDHAVQVGDYELQFCSEGCSERFQGDTEASILALSVEP